METKELSMEVIRLLPKAALARKHNCSVQYIRKILQSDSGYNSPRAQAIRRDAYDIVEILLREPLVYKNPFDYLRKEHKDIRL